MRIHSQTRTQTHTYAIFLSLTNILCKFSLIIHLKTLYTSALSNDQIKYSHELNAIVTKHLNFINYCRWLNCRCSLYTTLSRRWLQLLAFFYTLRTKVTYRSANGRKKQKIKLVNWFILDIEWSVNILMRSRNSIGIQLQLRCDRWVGNLSPQRKKKPDFFHEYDKSKRTFN